MGDDDGVVGGAPAAAAAAPAKASAKAQLARSMSKKGMRGVLAGGQDKALVSKTMNFVLKTRNFVLETRNLCYK